MNGKPDSVRVLHVLGPLRPSGMERMLASAGSHFREENITNVVLGQGTDHPFAEDLRSSGYEVRIVRSAAGSWSDARALRMIVHDLGIDVIHIHTEGNYLRTAIACKMAVGSRGRLVRTVHSVFDAKGIWRVKRLLQALIADRLLAALIAPSPDVAANEKKLGRRAAVVYNWVDDRFVAIGAARHDRVPATERFLALIVGNCSDIKHHELALRALLRSNHRLIHIGDETGASVSELALLGELARDGRLLDRGVKSPDEAMSRADYFMMPSRHEGMPVALAEALVAGIPALIADVPGLRWAKSLNGVSVLSQTQDSWDSGLVTWQGVNQDVSAVSIDFSAARGAHEYADIYRGASHRHAARNRRVNAGSAFS